MKMLMLLICLPMFAEESKATAPVLATDQENLAIRSAQVSSQEILTEILQTPLYMRLQMSQSALREMIAAAEHRRNCTPGTFDLRTLTCAPAPKPHVESTPKTTVPKEPKK